MCHLPTGRQVSAAPSPQLSCCSSVPPLRKRKGKCGICFILRQQILDQSHSCISVFKHETSIALRSIQVVRKIALRQVYVWKFCYVALAQGRWSAQKVRPTVYETSGIRKPLIQKTADPAIPDVANQKFANAYLYAWQAGLNRSPAIPTSDGGSSPTPPPPSDRPGFLFYVFCSVCSEKKIFRMN